MLKSFINTLIYLNEKEIKEMRKGFLATISAIAGMTVGAATIGKIQEKAIRSNEKDIDKFRSYYNMLNQWLLIKQEGRSLKEYFIKNGYKTLVIYGMGEMGNRLYEELKDTDIEVKYAIDKEADSVYSELKVVEKDSHLETADVMVVTAIYAYDEIEEEMETKIDFPIISLEEVIYEL